MSWKVHVVFPIIELGSGLSTGLPVEMISKGPSENEFTAHIDATLALFADAALTGDRCTTNSLRFSWVRCQDLSSNATESAYTAYTAYAQVSGNR